MGRIDGGAEGIEGAWGIEGAEEGGRLDCAEEGEYRCV